MAELRIPIALAHLPDDPDELPRVLTTVEVARVLGISIARVRRLEKAGKLHPKRDRAGNRQFERAEVLQFGHARGQRLRCELAGGPKAAEAFQLFDRKARLADVVIKLQLIPELVRELHAQWVSFQRPEPQRVVRLGDSQPEPIDDGKDLDQELGAGIRARQARLRVTR